MLMSHLLSWVIFLPLVGALVIVFLKKDEAIRWTAFGVMFIDLVISLPLWFGFDITTHEMQFVERFDWVRDFNIQYAVGLDGISLLLVLLTTILSPICILCSWKGINTRVKEFMISLLVMETAMIGVFSALDFVLFYVFWEAMLIPMYMIIGVWGGPRRIYAAIKFFLYTLAGSLLLLVVILALYFEGGRTFNIQVLMEQTFSASVQFWIFWAFFLAVAIKVPMFPFHTWLPDAHVEAPTAGSVILASVLLKMGAYGFLRFCLPLAPQASQTFMPLILWLSIIGIIYGAYMALAQEDMKKLIAYSSVSHMGFVTLGIFVFNSQGIEGAILQMINHGITTGALFLCVGFIYERTHSRMIKDYGGIAKSMPVFVTLFVIFGLSSLGLPGTNSFIGEFLILVGVFLDQTFFAVIAMLGIILAAVYILWMIQRVAFGEITKAENKVLADLTGRELLTVVPLVVFVFWIGFYPAPLLDVLHVTVDHLVAQVHQGQPLQFSEMIGGR